MFKKSPKNNYFFNSREHATGAHAATAAATATAAPSTILANGSASCSNLTNVGLCYYNHFTLPQVGLCYDTSSGNYIPLKLSVEYNKTMRPYISASVYSHLCDIKEQIEKYQEQWDNIKKFTNPYEYIHTNVSGNKTNISKLRPLSRSFYKMIEIITGNGILKPDGQDIRSKYPITTVPDYRMGINTFHLAEGPGGFIEAISYLRGTEYNKIRAQAPSNDSDTKIPTTTTTTTTTTGGGSVQILKRNTEFHDEYMKEMEHMKLSRRIFENSKQPNDGQGHPPIYGNDRYYGMTLVNDDPICPGWKKTRTFLEHNPNVIIETGEDKTGNLISLENFRYCAAKYKNKMDIVTADGGFDFSVDFNNQENIATTLILSEVFYALALQKEGGTFILKIFDIFHKPTIDILYLLSYYYTNVTIMKPYTSRVANSEKYVICQGFKIADSTQIIQQFCDIFPSIIIPQKVAGVNARDDDDGDDGDDDGRDNGAEDTLSSLVPREHDLYFLNKIEDLNAMISYQQIENITSTLAIITNHKNAEKLEQYKKTNIGKCIAWCEHYGIPYHKQNVLLQTTNIFLHRP
jgi:23S rRNA U2552 (ribose-2'-O)-methylase RlmE/FtsJ